MKKDIRYVQRFENFLKAFEQLERAVNLFKKCKFSNLEKRGSIKYFEYTHELSWNVLKDYLIRDGIQNLFGSVTVTREAFKLGLVKDGEVWMKMIKDRNETVHAYDEKKVDAIFERIVKKYFPEFSAFKKTFTVLQKNEK